MCCDVLICAVHQQRRFWTILACIASAPRAWCGVRPPACAVLLHSQSSEDGDATQHGFKTILVLLRSSQCLICRVRFSKDRRTAYILWDANAGQAQASGGCHGSWDSLLCCTTSSTCNNQLSYLICSAQASHKSVQQRTLVFTCTFHQTATQGPSTHTPHRP